MTDLLSLSGKDLDRELSRIEKSNPKGYRFWTEKEEVVLRRLWPSISIMEVAKALGRSYSSVEKKARAMGL